MSAANPDNVAQLSRNLVVSESAEGHVSAERDCRQTSPSKISVAYISNHMVPYMCTAMSSARLRKLSYTVVAASPSPRAVAALLAVETWGDSQCESRDLFHERHRQDPRREFATIKQVAKENGASRGNLPSPVLDLRQ